LSLPFIGSLPRSSCGRGDHRHHAGSSGGAGWADACAHLGEAETQIYATALALESREGDTVLDQAIMVSCDIVAIRQGLIELVREKAKDKLPGFDLNKLFLNATHTHTAPVTMKGDRYACSARR
jgi:UDP-N-acetyl-D-mannosaminuronic acid transferase (WecB/TagA/CpsF family)